MTRDEIIYLIPYLASLAISASVLVYAWTRRNADGAFAFTWYMLGQTLWVAGFIFELISKDINNKIFWDGFQWLASLLITLAIPVFCVQYTEYKLHSPKILFGLSFIAPAIFILALFSDSYIHLIYVNPKLSSATPFAELLYSFTPIVYGYAIYSYIIAFWSLYLLGKRVIRPHGLYRGQAALVTLGIFIPILGTILALFDIHIAPQRDATPLTSAIGNLLIVWGLFRFRFFDLVPIARDKVFEGMVEPVVILDNNNMIVDINSSMLILLEKSSNEVIGRPAKEIFNNFPIPIKLYTHVSYARDEATFELRGKKIYYELTIWPLFNDRKEMTGRIYISHDITALKELEQELRKLNSELEDRVRARTSQLAEAYDTTLEGWARALELRDKETEGHSRRVTDTTLKVATTMGMDDDSLVQIRRGALLHDIGKMGVPDEILHKPGKLNDEERAIIQKHPQTAYQLLSPISFLKKALEIPYHHHEKWDGSGYPQGLREHEIPMSARIFAVADVWDAVTSNRPYNKAWSRKKAISYLVEESGKHFDPRVVNIFLDLVEKGEI